MQSGRVAALLAAGTLVFTWFAIADEIIETSDGRKMRLRSDGTYELLARLDPAKMEGALAAAKEWARDQTLIAGCFRETPDRKMLSRSFAADRNDALARLRRAGATERQQRQIAVAIDKEYRAPADADDANPLPLRCATIQHDVFTLNGRGRPLMLREPFREWK